MSVYARYVAYHCAEAPPGRQWLGQIFLTPEPTQKKPEPAETAFGMNFFAGTEAAALHAAEDWWTNETAKVAARDAGIAARTQAARAHRLAARDQTP